jgi:hypothetical protein
MDVGQMHDSMKCTADNKPPYQYEGCSLVELKYRSELPGIISTSLYSHSHCAYTHSLPLYAHIGLYLQDVNMTMYL